MLYDIVACHGINSRGIFPQRKLLEYITTEIKTCPVFRIDNVSEYLYIHDERDRFSIYEDFPNLAPPFKSIWMEATLPSIAVSKTTGLKTLDYRGQGVDRYGILLLYFDKDELFNYVQLDLRGYRLQDDYKWHCIAFPIVRNFRDGLAYTANVAPIYAVQNDGKPVRIIKFDEVDDVIDPVLPIGDPEALQRIFDVAPKTKSVPSFVYPALMAVSFMHCKNVTVKREWPDRPLSKAFQRRHGSPLVSWDVLEIEPMKKVLATEGNSQLNGLKKALHICRGHFATYDVKPLFGRIKGTFWISQHMRGAIEQGIHYNDYKVKEPRRS